MSTSVAPSEREEDIIIVIIIAYIQIQQPYRDEAHTSPVGSLHNRLNVLSIEIMEARDNLRIEETQLYERTHQMPVRTCTYIHRALPVHPQSSFVAKEGILAIWPKFPL